MLFKAFKLGVLPLRITFLLEKSRDGIKEKELIFFIIIIQMLVEMVLKANTMSVCEILKRKFSSSHY